jgi:hypothetical protein
MTPIGRLRVGLLSEIFRGRPQEAAAVLGAD